jgi:hypothetical protein
VVASAESAAAIGKIGVDASRFEGRLGVAEQICERARGFVGRLHADNELEVLAAGVIPGKAAFRLESHRVDRLRLEFAVQHQKCRIVRSKFRADLFAIGRGFGIGLPGWEREPCPDRASELSKTPGLTQPFLTGE